MTTADRRCYAQGGHKIGHSVSNTQSPKIPRWRRAIEADRFALRAYDALLAAGVPEAKLAAAVYAVWKSAQWGKWTWDRLFAMPRREALTLARRLIRDAEALRRLVHADRVGEREAVEFHARQLEGFAARIESEAEEIDARRAEPTRTARATLEALILSSTGRAHDREVADILAALGLNVNVESQQRARVRRQR